MFDRIGKGHVRASGFGAASGLRHIPVWLAVLALYLQLFAAALCIGSSRSSEATNAFSICHTPGNGDPSGSARNKAPTGRSCPFCAIHCKAAMALAPSIGVSQTFIAVSTRVEHLAAPALVLPARLFLSAPPRGPPVSA